MSTQRHLHELQDSISVRAHSIFDSNVYTALSSEDHGCPSLRIHIQTSLVRHIIQSLRPHTAHLPSSKFSNLSVILRVSQTLNLQVPQSLGHSPVYETLLSSNTMAQEQCLSSGWTYDETIKLWELVEERLKITRARLNLADFQVIKDEMDSHFALTKVQVGDLMWPRAVGGVTPSFAYSSVRRAFPERTANALHSYITKKDSPRAADYEAYCKTYVV
ncbi:uncharacterized protein LY89DRAFT_735937 [Mollisia scopiformis]|uniref:Uncharacterized protein n=1 Tax=Mollisia scopiformis TaxID=149040 RepID=A0A194X3W3_MOLSC|nr:uncharacterized protein LY89DRAFT_735937 [Mollisia scopiformis]KUJ14875.1 hypothetical protein LY89DRAFT_735937 [Mollisia scopiformis]